MTKRKFVGDTEHTQPPAKRKKQAATTTRSAATKATIQRNAYTSPLLKLPGEIRVKIFSLVVGHQFIHLLYSQTRGKMLHTVCTASASEDEVYERFVTGRSHLPSDDSAEYPDLDFSDRHDNCTSWDRNELRVGWGHYVWRCVPMSMAVKKPPKPMLDLSLLGVCRQVYEEANFLLWTTNTFSFENDVTLHTFIKSLQSTQKEKLRRLHFDLTWNSLSIDWHVPRVADLISGLDGLRKFHATLKPVGRFLERELLLLLYEIRTLPLQHVTIVICDSMNLGEHGWAITERREVAKNVRSKLLEPHSSGDPFAERKVEVDEA